VSQIYNITQAYNCNLLVLLLVDDGWANTTGTGISKLVPIKKGPVKIKTIFTGPFILI
jgi:hypothetical protein